MRTPIPTEINGTKYFRVKEFAALTNRTTQSVYSLVKKGNAKRKLLCTWIGDIPYIPASELTDFPFIKPGPYSENNVYHYTKEGELVQ
jgi:hypothetical protein